MGGWIDGWMGGRTDGWTDGRTDGRTDGWMGGRTDGRTDGRMDGWMGGRTGGWNLNMLLELRELLLLGLMYDMSSTESYINIPLVCTRQAEKVAFKTQIVQYDIYRRSPYYVGSNLWNGFTVEIQNSQSHKEFKSSVKRFFKNRKQNE